MSERKGIIYKATNKITGKCYVGQTVLHIARRIGCHYRMAKNSNSSTYNTKFGRALRKYKRNDWEWEVVCDNIPIQYLGKYEIWYIDFYCSRKFGYNTNIGGAGFKPFIEKNDLSGRKFNKWTVIEEIGRAKDGAILYLCKCDCGKEYNIEKRSLVSNRTSSCLSCCQKKHGMKYTKIYQIWRHMKNACYNTGVKDYAKNGAIGVKVCKEWINSFEQFYKDMGDRTSENMILGRHNVKEDYTTENCLWMTRNAQGILKNSNIISSSGYKGVFKSGKKWMARMRINGEKIYLGTFDSPEAASEVYNKAVTEHYGTRK